MLQIVEVRENGRIDVYASTERVWQVNSTEEGVMTTWDWVKAQGGFTFERTHGWTCVRVELRRDGEVLEALDKPNVRL